jgi:hypothetical protein
MVFLSGKRDRTSNLKRLIDPCLNYKAEEVHQQLLYGNYKDKLSSRVSKLAELYVLSKPINGHLHHACTPIRSLPEYELYNAWLGIPKTYNDEILNTIRESLRKKIPYSKIKSQLNLCHKLHLPL